VAGNGRWRRNMTDPEIGGRAPIPIEGEAGKSYWW